MIVKSKLIPLVASTVVAAGLGLLSPAGVGGAGGTDIHPNKETKKDTDRGTDPGDLEARLSDARARAGQAPPQGGELPSELGGPLVDRFIAFDEFSSRAVIGVQLDPQSGTEGAKIQEVSPGGPAQEAGLRGGDVITQINGTDVKGDRTARQVVRLMRKIE